MTARQIIAVLVLGGVTGCQGIAMIEPPTCAPLGLDKPGLEQMKANAFAIADDSRRASFALDLLPCLGHPDPEIRDGIAYEAFFTLIREQQLDADTLRQLHTGLARMLQAPDDPAGFRQPFAALVLAEVARADRVTPFLDDTGRSDLVDTATQYLARVGDYRGFDAAQGWRHGVAHGADLLMQLALNPGLRREQLLQILDAVAGQVAPTTHFYIYGEPHRLMRPVYFVAQRGLVSEREWLVWFERLAAPAPFENWNEMHGSQAGLARLHNTRAFATALYPYVAVTEDDPRESLHGVRQGVRILIGALP